jgi:hypothetical protein
VTALATFPRCRHPPPLVVRPRKHSREVPEWDQAKTRHAKDPWPLLGHPRRQLQKGVGPAAPPRSGHTWLVRPARSMCTGPRRMIKKGKPRRSESLARRTTCQLKLKEPVTPISRRLLNESPRENIFAIKTAGAEFFKPPMEGKYKIIGRKTFRGYEKQLIP